MYHSAPGKCKIATQVKNDGRRRGKLSLLDYAVLPLTPERTMQSATELGDLSQPRGWPVDAHVHLHRLDAVPATLDAAAANFQRAAPGREGLLGGLLLTQTAREQVFEALNGRDQVGDWQFERVADEPETLLARRGSRTMALVCGRQVRAADGLEVAALGTRQSFVDGRPFAESLAAVLESGAVAAIPWGFGKWTGRRGRVVETTMVNQAQGRVFLGDSGGRAALLGVPTLIRSARARGIPVLAGTDPFPFAGDHRRVGSFGFLAEIEPDPRGPWRALRAWLRSVSTSPALYGRPSGPVRFAINQVGVQFYNRMPRSAAP